jgi:hypothetical protein
MLSQSLHPRIGALCERVDDADPSENARILFHAIQHVGVVKTIEAHLDQDDLLHTLGPAVFKQLLGCKAWWPHLGFGEASPQWVFGRVWCPYMDVGVYNSTGRGSRRFRSTTGDTKRTKGTESQQRPPPYSGTVCFCAFHSTSLVPHCRSDNPSCWDKYTRFTEANSQETVGPAFG